MTLLQQSPYFILTLALSLSGQIMLKKGLSRLMEARPRSLMEFVSQHLLSLFVSPYIWLGIVLCGLGLVCWLLLLSMFEIGRALPVLGGLACVAMFFLGKFVLNEPTRWVHFGGLLLIVTGIWLVAAPAAPATSATPQADTEATQTP